MCSRMRQCGCLRVCTGLAGLPVEFPPRASAPRRCPQPSAYLPAGSISSIPSGVTSKSSRLLITSGAGISPLPGSPVIAPSSVSMSPPDELGLLPLPPQPCNVVAAISKPVNKATRNSETIDILPESTSANANTHGSGGRRAVSRTHRSEVPAYWLKARGATPCRASGCFSSRRPYRTGLCVVTTAL